MVNLIPTTLYTTRTSCPTWSAYGKTISKQDIPSLTFTVQMDSITHSTTAHLRSSSTTLIASSKTLLTSSPRSTFRAQAPPAAAAIPPKSALCSSPNPTLSFSPDARLPTPVGYTPRMDNFGLCTTSARPISALSKQRSKQNTHRPAPVIQHDHQERRPVPPRNPIRHRRCPE